MKNLLFLLIIWYVIGAIKCNRCVNRANQCISRFELQHDFPFAFEFNCTVVPNCKCYEGMSVVFYDFPPYIEIDKRNNRPKGLLPGLLDQVINLCCYGCNRIRFHPPISNLGAMFSSELRNVSYTAIFPILATKAVKQYFAGPFISMISTPGVSYVTVKNDNGDSYDHLVTALRDTWPLLALSVLLALNAGFVVWLLDTRGNPSNFPRPFPRGALEGGWWAFVSMTTVGYGDKCPESILSRIFAIFWIVFGIALSGIFTASITTALTVSLSADVVDLGRTKVGVLNITRYEQNIALRENAEVVEFGKIENMKEALKSGTVKGLLIDNNVLGYNWEFLKDGMSLDVNTNVKNTETTYGIMFHTHFANGSDAIANKEWADYLSTFFDYNTDNENIMLSIARKSLSKEISKEPFLKKTKTTGLPPTVYNGLFKQIAYSTCTCIIIGIIYEIVRRICIKKNIDMCRPVSQIVDSMGENAKKQSDVEMNHKGTREDRILDELELLLNKIKELNTGSNDSQL